LLKINTGGAILNKHTVQTEQEWGIGKSSLNYEKITAGEIRIMKPVKITPLIKRLSTFFAEIRVK
jgi:hypothetical protein